LSLAKIIISGTLASDPEKRFTSNDHPVTNFTLAVKNVTGSGKQQQSGDEVFHVKVACWRGLADAVEAQLKKGDEVVVEGKLMMDSYQGQEGVQKKGFEVEASAIDKLPGVPEPILAAAGAGSSSSGGSQDYTPARSSNGGGMGPKSQEAPPSGHFSSEELLTEDDIPF
jgi:single-strand DNA-binding protein